MIEGIFAALITSVCVFVLVNEFRIYLQNVRNQAYLAGYKAGALFALEKFSAMVQTRLNIQLQEDQVIEEGKPKNVLH
jgi:hypothetical protein